MKKNNIIFFLIILIAIVFRLIFLDSIPPGVNRDEASIGVTAFSLLTTGRDEYGRTLPLSFESFGDWKLPLYIYTTIPFIKLFGLSEIAVRLPSAIFGIATVGGIFYFTKILFGTTSIALIASFILAIMPWHMHISRVESEAIVSVGFTVFGSLLFLSALGKRSLFLLTVSAILFSLTYYTYHGTHISTSLLVVGIFTIYWKEIIKINRWWVALCTAVVMVGFILTTTFGADHTKISGISIFGDPFVIHSQIENPRSTHDKPNSLVAKLSHNRFTYAILTMYQNYLKSYGTEFLFIKGGGNSAHNIGGYGNLHPIEAPLLLLGFVSLMTLIKKKESKFILWWVAIGAVAASITKDAPHSNRMLAVVPALAITSALGIDYLLKIVPKKLTSLAIIILIVGYSGCLLYFSDRYFNHFPKNEAGNWGYAYRILTPFLFSQEQRDKKIIMTKPETSPYIYVLFYNGYNASDYQRQATRYPISRDGFTDVSGFDRFSFRAVDWKYDLTQKNTIIVAGPDEVSHELDAKITKTIKLPDGSIKFVVLDTNK